MAGRIGIAAVLLFFALGASALDLGPELPPGMADLATGEGFIVLTADARIRYEAGAEQMAVRIAALLPDAVAQVERVHGRPFRQPVQIFVLASERSFVRLSPQALALTSRARVYTSPKLFRNSARVPGILTHELSHAHFMQYLGSGRAAPEIPAWFREGFAVWLAGGAGAERVSHAEAAQAILKGDAAPLERNRRGGHLAASRSTHGPHMFYRQSAMFVEYLRYLDPYRFDRFVANVLDGIPFDRAFRERFGNSPDQMWASFAAGLHARR